MSISMKSLLESITSNKPQTEQLNESSGNRMSVADVSSYIKVFNELHNGGAQALEVVDFKRHVNGIYFIWYDANDNSFNINNIEKSGDIGQPLEYDIPYIDEAKTILRQMR